MKAAEYNEISEDLQGMLTHLSGFSPEELANKNLWESFGSSPCCMWLKRCKYCYICDDGNCRWVEVICI